VAMAVSFGEQLRLAREARGITLKDISEQTRISTQYLEAIEKDEYKKLPGGIFNRSFIKAYARSVGFDENEALDAYKRTADSQGNDLDDVSSSPHKFQVLTYDQSARSPLVTALLTGIVLLILSLGIYAALHWYMNRNSSTPTNNQPLANTPAETPNQTTPANNTTPPPIDPNAFTIQLKAKEEVWVRFFNDGEKNSSFANVMSKDATQEVKPQQQIRIQVSKDKVNALEVTINGRLANVQFQDVPKVPLVQVIIKKDDYKQMLAQ